MILDYLRSKNVYNNRSTNWISILCSNAYELSPFNRSTNTRIESRSSKTKIRVHEFVSGALAENCTATTVHQIQTKNGIHTHANTHAVVKEKCQQQQ